jgi:hypothetical protein
VQRFSQFILPPEHQYSVPLFGFINTRLKTAKSR